MSRTILENEDGVSSTSSVAAWASSYATCLIWGFRFRAWGLEFSHKRIPRVYWGYIGIMENKMETTMMGLYIIV